MSLVVNRSGRGDRTGRYGNTNNDHNFRDMDYRGYEQEDEEPETNRPYGHDEQLTDAHDFKDRLGFHHRGDGRKDIGDEEKGIMWPPCSQSHPDTSPHLLNRAGKGSRREFEQLGTGLQERVQGKDGRGFAENTPSLSGSREGSWGRGGGHSDRIEYSTARQREEERFSREPVKRRVSHPHYKVASLFWLH